MQAIPSQPRRPRRGHLRSFVAACLTAAAGLLPHSAASAHTTQAGKILDAGGNAITLRGVNWFGFETANHIPHGLWTRNWRSTIEQMKSLGFNAVRLPFCPDTLRGAAISSVDFVQNPDLNGLNSLAALDLMMKGLNDTGMYVLLDHHRPDCNAISELWTTPSYSEKNWIDDLVFVAKRYQSLPRFIGIDLKNEPHGAATWGFGNAATDWNRAAERAAAAVLAANSELLIFVEGVQENPVCSSRTNHWWGGNLEPIACAPLQIPAHKLVLSPHVYGPDVYDQPYFAAPNFPANMPAIWDQQFGALLGAGYTIAVGEFGGRYGHGGSAKDKVWQDAMVDYLIAKGARSAFYWSWNPNSGDTGGVLQDDWQTPWPDKVALLQRLWGGSPGAAPSPGGTAGTVSPTPAPAPAPTPALTTRVVVNSDYASGYCADVQVHNGGAAAQRWQVAFAAEGRVRQLWNANWSQTGGTISAEGLDWNRLVAAGGDVSFGFCADRSATVVPSPTSGTSAGATSTLVTRVAINNDWGAGYCADVKVGNDGDTAVAWRISVPIAGTVTQAWSAQWSQSANVLSAQGLDWNRLVAARGTSGFGFCASR